MCVKVAFRYEGARLNTSFKIPAVQLERLDELVRRGIYVSRSEIIRESFIETIEGFLMQRQPGRVANSLNEGLESSSRHPGLRRRTSLFQSSTDRDEDHQKRIVCVSVPEYLLTLIDDLITLGFFESRSHFARSSIGRNLERTDWAKVIFRPRETDI